MHASGWRTTADDAQPCPVRGAVRRARRTQCVDVVTARTGDLRTSIDKDVLDRLIEGSLSGDGFGKTSILAELTAPPRYDLPSPTAQNATRRSPPAPTSCPSCGKKTPQCRCRCWIRGDGLPSPYPARQQAIPEEDSEDLFSYFHGHRRHLSSSSRIAAWHSNRNT